MVVAAIPSIGYVHRGLEKVVEKREFPEYLYVAERICGICSFIHASTYVQVIEAVMGIELPERALLSDLVSLQKLILPGCLDGCNILIKIQESCENLFIIFTIP
jgi:Ni,Fe-hydrogenase I large subunit